MKISEKIVIRLAFLLAVLFCLGLEVYSDYNTPICTVELSSEANVPDNGLNSDVDAFDDNQMNAVDEYSSIIEPMFRLPKSKDLFSLQKFTSSNWQPPKNSDTRV